MNLADQYRPQIFEEVRGQAEAVATIIAQLRRDVPLPLLLCGPPGVGKTTLALIVARALNCEAPSPSGSPCLACNKCVDFDTSDRVYFFVELNAGRLGGKDAAAYIDEIARLPPMWGARRRVAFIDEAHALTNAAQDNLLDVLERLGTAAFLLATNQPERLGPAFRSRCVVVNLALLPAAALIEYGREVCALEGIEFEPDALAMVAAAAQGQVRDFLLKLEEVAARGPVTAASAAGVLDLAWADMALSALTLLLRTGYADAVAALSEWRALAGVKAGALRDALAFVAQRRFLIAPSAGVVHAAFLGASVAVVDELAAAVVQRATVLGVAPVRCVVEWGVFWSACTPTVHADGDLTVRLLEFALRVCPPETALPPLPPPVAPVVPAPVRRRAVVCAAQRPSVTSANARGVWLSKREACGVYQAATLLPQAYGLWFNARLVLRYADYGVTDTAAALRLFSALTHELGLRVRDWVGDAACRLHWLAQHEGDDAGGGLATRLLLHAPPPLFERARSWLADDFLPVPEGVLVHALGSDVWRAGATARPHVTHWALVRELWRILNPAVVDVDERGRRQPLPELLGVQPQRPRTPGALPARVRRYSTSRTLGSAVWRAAEKEPFAFVSAFKERAWGALDSGWEVHEHAYRRAEAEQRMRARDVLTAQLPRGVCAAQDAAFEERLRALRETWPLDPLLRPRPRPLW